MSYAFCWYLAPSLNFLALLCMETGRLKFVFPKHTCPQIWFRFHQRKGLLPDQEGRRGPEALSTPHLQEGTGASAEGSCEFLGHHLGMLLPFMDFGAVESRDLQWCFYEFFHFNFFQRLYKQLALYIVFSCQKLLKRFLFSCRILNKYKDMITIPTHPPKKKISKKKKNL